MAGMVAADTATSDETAGGRGSGVSDRVIWAFVAIGIATALASLALPSDDARSLLYDFTSIAAAGIAVWGILRNDPRRRGAWQLVAVALTLFAAGDVTFDVAARGFGRPDGFPFADAFYVLAYPILAFALVRLARTRFDRATVIDSTVVSITLSAVVWQWVVTPVLDATGTPRLDQLATVLYPLMDILLVVVIVHAVLTLPRWTPAAWLLFAGLTMMMIADALYARSVAAGTYIDGDFLDALWPVSYLLMAAALMHPSMRALWEGRDHGPVRDGRARMVVLGTALFAVPGVVLLDDSGSTTTVMLAVVTACAAVAVAWRIMSVVDEANHARVILGESEARFRALVQHATDVVIVLAGDGTIRYVSPAVESTFGTPVTTLLGTRFTDYLDDDGVARSASLQRRLAARPDQPLTTELRVRTDIGWRWIEATWSNQLQVPAVRGVVGNVRDVTDRKRADAFAVEETRVLELILSGAPVATALTTLLRAIEVYVPDGAGTIRTLDADQNRLEIVAAPTVPGAVIDAVTEVLEQSDLSLARSVRTLQVRADLTHEPTTRGRVDAVSLAHGYRGIWEMPIRTIDDAEFLGMLTFYVTNPREPREDEIGVLERARDLTALVIDRDARTRELGRLALHDTLTGLPNRALAHDRLEHALERLADADDGRKVALLFIDLDRFKLVNDGLGHDTGDELLVAVSRRLAATVRRQDTIARIGGDEFVVLCEDLEDESLAIDLADRAARAFDNPFTLSRAEVTVSASIGIAVTDRSSERASSLLQDADAAMYRAKRRGGARHELFDDDMHTQAVSRLLTERAIRRALEGDELRVLYQPAFDLASGARVGLEALLRWEHPVRGLVVPRDFLRVAEETGMIVPMGAWVLEQACRVTRTLRASDDPGMRDLMMAVNVSACQLQRPEFPDHVARIIDASGIDAQQVCLEVAESALLDDLDTMGDALRALKGIGLRLAIDDFGTGGSSLTYLRRFPFDELKIDQMFVDGIGRSAADDAIVAATIDMAHALGMAVTAEGVETEDQREKLAALGCDRAQGYLLGEPEAVNAPHLVLLQQRPA